MNAKIKTWTLRFPAKENPNMEKALFDWPVVLHYDVKAKYRLISRKFSGMKFFHPSDKPSKSLYSVRLLFLLCSRVFMLRSYENRSKKTWNYRCIERALFRQDGGICPSLFCSFVSAAVWNLVGLYFFSVLTFLVLTAISFLFLQRHQTFYSDKNLQRFWLGILTNRSTLFVGQEMLFRRFRALIPSTSLR